MSMMATNGRFNDPEKPYNDLPLLPPRQDLETREVLKAAIDAHVALAELRGAARSIPDDSILVRAIALQEARVSSEIELIVTTSDELYRALSQEEVSSDPHTKEVLRYSAAVWQGYRHLQDDAMMDHHLYQHLASTILQKPTGFRRGSGTRVGDPRTGKVVYTPPVGVDRIQALLENLSVYWNNENGIDPLIRLCVGHYQFEAIHPFPDSNGRVGRVLNILYLIQQKLLDKPILYLSRAIIDDKPSYYQGIRRVTEQGDWEAWVLYMLNNIAVTAIETRRRVEAIHEDLQFAIDQARAQMNRGYSMELIRLIYSQPYTRIQFLDRAGIAKRQAASEYLQELERIGLLRGEKRGREMYYVNDRLLSILTL
jgi:Fic family protein